jgi:rod shape-determining protein MreB
MFSKFINKFTTKLYIQICDKRLKVLNLKTGVSYEDKPLIAMGTNTSGEEILLAIGKEASFHPNTINPFSHPRVIIDDFEMAEIVLRHAFEKVTQNKIIFSPIAIIQIMKEFDTPLTVIEKMAICELSTNAGARETIIYDGVDLDIITINYEELREISFCCEERIKAWSGVN